MFTIDEEISKIDWSIHDKFPENTIECRCGTIYRSHSKAHFIGDGFTIVSRKPCPSCNSRHNIFASRSDPENYTL